MNSGSLGLYISGQCTNAIVLNNDLSGATTGGIGYVSMEYSLANAQIFGNIIGQGLTYHLQVPYTQPVCWFAGRNIYLGAGSRSGPALIDPLSAPIHLSPQSP